VSEASQARAKQVIALRDAYRATFLHPKSPELLPHATIVLRDLRATCCADRPTIMLDKTGAVDTYATLANEGARRVWLKIMQGIRLDDSDLHRMLKVREDDTWMPT